MCGSLRIFSSAVSSSAAAGCWKSMWSWAQETAARGRTARNVPGMRRVARQLCHKGFKGGPHRSGAGGGGAGEPLHGCGHGTLRGKYVEGLRASGHQPFCDETENGGCKITRCAKSHMRNVRFRTFFMSGLTPGNPGAGKERQTPAGHGAGQPLNFLVWTDIRAEMRNLFLYFPQSGMKIALI